MTPDLDPDRDLVWLAFQYAVEELGPEDADAFERRLDVDQSAREALAEAVGLTQALLVSKAEVFSSSVVPFKRHGRTTRRLATLAAAACILAVVTFGLGRLDRDDPRPEPSPSSVGLAWSGLRVASEPFTAERTDESLDWLDEFTTEGDVGSDFEEEDGPPGWLLEAVALRETAEPDPEQVPQGL
ncbi:MAG: hypothetical protein AB7I30_21165 [Isosphaeraceae bacterium]